MSKKKQRKLVRQSLIETAKTVFEAGPLWCWPQQRVLSYVRRVYGEDLLKVAMEAGNGVILAIPHLGAWELVGLYCSAHYPMTSLYKAPKIAALGQFMRAARERFGAHLVPTNNSGIRALYQTLEKGELIAILPDQEPDAGSGVFTSFFGRQAKTMVLLPRLARRTGAVVLFSYARRLPKGAGYELFFQAATPGVSDEDLLVSAQSLNQGVEQCIKAAPEQYQWSYKRFKTRPEGEKAIYQ